MNEPERGYEVLSETAVRALLGQIAPASELLAIDDLPGAYSNYTHLVTARSARAQSSRFVVRRYAVFGDYDRGEKARREYKTLQLLQREGIPAPRPLYLDDSGSVLGVPGIVTDYVPGAQVDAPADPLSWARSLARLLARIHAVPCEAAAQAFLLDANAEASWFLRPGTVPDFMAAHPEGPSVWQAVHDQWSCMQAAPVGLVHIDYWSGNVLWDAGQIVAVVDWEEAAYGDPAIDVAYCRMDMFLSGLREAAEEFLATYERETGRRVANLGLWELAAAARPMFNPGGWITESSAKEPFSRFIADARARAGY